MEEDQELKHVCKFCSKRFGCGRSLGGHMRSHMINDISAQSDGTKLTRKKLPSLHTFINNNNNNGTNKNNTTSTETTTTTTPASTGYGLRENTKKTWRLKNHSSTEDTSSLHLDKSCKECGKSFSSWKALFGHMKCHSLEKERVLNNTNNNSLDEEYQDSWTSGDGDQKLVMDSQSDNETPAPNRRKRSKRRTKYLVTANSSSLSFADNKINNPSSPVSEIEQEQEEVAMCLMLLSRDVGQWGGFNSVAESSDKNSVFLETNQVNPKAETKNSICNRFETQKLKQCSDKKSEIGKLEPESSEFTRNLTTLDEAEMGSSKCNPSKGKLQDSVENSESKSESLKKLTTNALVDNKGSKFECATCNKVFYSYQALGGHRASHKKIKGCFASKIDSSENSIDTEVTPDAANIDQTITESDNKGETSDLGKKNRGHKCPICLRVFPSGQALGGHKRSHLVVGAIEAKNSSNQTIRIEEPIPGIRDFLDLNLPAPVEEESNGIAGFNPWWIPGTHKHEPLVGLISNQVL